MFTSTLIQNALYLAVEAHKGQVRRGWHEYILHPVAVAIEAMSQGMDDVCVACALLHDVVEDTPITFIHLESLTWVTDEMIEILSLLTKAKGENSHDHVTRILKSGNIKAIKLKKLDLEHNSYVHPKDYWEGMGDAIIRYKLAIERINNHLGL